MKGALICARIGSNNPIPIQARCVGSADNRGEPEIRFCEVDQRLLTDGAV
jgi:hypothetical protein